MYMYIYIYIYITYWKRYWQSIPIKYITYDIYIYIYNFWGPLAIRCVAEIPALAVCRIFHDALPAQNMPTMNHALMLMSLLKLPCACSR